MSERAVIEKNLRAHLEQLAVPRHAQLNRAGHESVARYIRSTLAATGLKIEPQTFSLNGSSYENWVASHPAQDPHAPLLVIGAHYDTVPDSPGADDNASGVAVLLEAAEF